MTATGDFKASQGVLPLGVCIWPQPGPNAGRTVQHPEYLFEILDHAGFCYSRVEPSALQESLDSLRILVTVGEAKLAAELQDQLTAWIHSGGQWISVGGVCGLGDILGVEPELPTYTGWAPGPGMLGEGYLSVQNASHPVLSEIPMPLHFFNGVAARATTARPLAAVLDAHQRPTTRAAVTEQKYGAGQCLLIAIDVPGTVVHIQQGVSVACDGVPAPDGTAGVADLVLKSDDGAVLDWSFDRQPMEGVSGLSLFGVPIADAWRALLLKTIFHAAQNAGVTLTLLWFYPRNLPAIGHISHDTDGNDVSRAYQLLETLAQAEIRSSWCTILPGYPPEVMAAIRDTGHELAMHYDSMDHPWSETEFDSQWHALTDLFKGHLPLTNKNHYLRWEGYTDVLHWCEARGIRMDQSKGASKTGEAGFNFGSCHPWYAVTHSGRKIDVLELATITQDLLVFAPEAIVHPLLAAVMAHYGVLHLLFHPAHIDKPGVAQSLLDAVSVARSRGLEWWTGEQISQWEHARREVRWSACTDAASDGSFSIACEQPLKDATLLFLAPEPMDARIGGQEIHSVPVERWGFQFQSVVMDIEAGSEYKIYLAGPKRTDYA